MGKDKTKKKSGTKSETLQTSSTIESKVIETAEIPESMKESEVEPKLEEAPKPEPKYNGPAIIFKNLDVKSGGVVTIKCIDDKVPLGKIQILQITAGDATYVYKRI